METQETLDPKRRAAMRQLVKAMQHIITTNNEYERLQKERPGYKCAMFDEDDPDDGLPPIPKELPEKFKAYL